MRVQFDADVPKPSIGGTVTLWANYREAGHGRIDRTVFRRFSGYSAMDIDRDTAYQSTAKPTATRHCSPFTGTVKKI